MLPEQSELETIELTIEEAKEKIARRDALDRLLEHPDFKLLVSEGLFEKEAIRLVRASAFPGNRNPESQEMLASRIGMISEFQLYLAQIRTEADNSERALVDHYNTRDEIMAEEMGAVDINGGKE